VTSLLAKARCEEGGRELAHLPARLCQPHIKLVGQRKQSLHLSNTRHLSILSTNPGKLFAAEARIVSVANCDKGVSSRLISINCPLEPFAASAHLTM
jgi:hypothetical protein